MQAIDDHFGSLECLIQEINGEDASLEVPGCVVSM